MVAFVEFDRYKMASGVYRHGRLFSSDSTEILFHKDGKTATVDLLKGTDGGISIATNGKTDARIAMSENTSPGNDESTMILLGALPLLFHPQARTAAVIGMGSGLTTHVLLTETRLERVDTIEIEPAIIEAARGFRPHVEAPFSDSRSYFHVDDAKSFFSANRSRYDIIVSEPSNPWVSGVANLFTDEFYRRARTYLNPGGIFVQWIHVYEMDLNLVASVMKAIGRNFSDYSLHAANDSDLLIVAVRDGKMPSLGKDVSTLAGLFEQLRRADIATLDDLALRRIGDRAQLDPLFVYAPAPVNSDFFPILDLHAVHARFMKNDVTALALLRMETLPAIEILGGEIVSSKRRSSHPSAHFTHARRAHAAAIISDVYLNRSLPATGAVEPGLMRRVLLTQRLAKDCRGESAPDLWLDSVYDVINATAQYLDPSTMNLLWRQLRASDCHRRLHAVQRDVFALFDAIGQRDAPKIASHAEKLLNGGKVPYERGAYLLATGMLGYLSDDKPDIALQLWRDHSSEVLGTKPPSLLLRLLWSHSVYRSQRQEPANLQ
ncbi:MAG: spermidine synthase [Sulfuricaulis sp.]